MIKKFMKKYLGYFLFTLFFSFFPLNQGLALNKQEIKEIRQEIKKFSTKLEELKVSDVFTCDSKNNPKGDFDIYMKGIKERTYYNDRAYEISDLVEKWGKELRNHYKETIINDVVVDLSETTAYWFHNGELINKTRIEWLVNKTKVAVGDEKISKGTKIGTCVIGKKVPYPKSHWNSNSRSITILYGHPYNSYGARKLELWKDGKYTRYSMHGTNDESSIGKHISMGCVRFYNSDVLIFYELVKEKETIVRTIE